MKCSKCGTKINKKFNLCPNCGEKVKKAEKNENQNIKRNKLLVLIIAGILLAICISLVVILNSKKSDTLDFDKLKSSVVIIYVYNENNELISSGSGVVAFEDDIILTNAHVIEDNYRIEVISENNTKYQVDGVLDYNKKKDIAILKLVSSKGLKKVEIGNSIKTGKDVTAIGSPLGLKNTISTGIISGNFQDNIEVYQHTAPISPGSSGGALFDNSGKLIGITYASINGGQNLNLAIPIKHYKKEYDIVKDNDVIDTQYYTWLKNSIIKTKEGSKLISYALNDKFENYKWKSGLYDEYIYKKGTLDRCLSLSNCIYGGEEEFEKMRKNIIASVFLSSGYGDLVCIKDLDDSDCKPIEGSNYTLAIIKLNTIDIKVIEKSKNIILSIPVLEKSKIESKNNYVYALECQNYDDCDSVKKILNELINH